MSIASRVRLTWQGVRSAPWMLNSRNLLVATMVNMGGGVVFWALAARLYSPSAVGIATSVMALEGVIVLASRLGFEQSVVRFFHQHNSGKLVATALTITTGAGLIIGVLALSIPGSIPSTGAMTAALLLTIICFHSFFAVLTTAFYGIPKTTSAIILAVVLLIRIPTLLLVGSFSTVGILGSIAVAYTASSVIGLVLLGRAAVRIGWPSLSLFRETAAYTASSYLTHLAIAASEVAIPWLVFQTSGIAESARYFIGYTLISPVYYIATMIGTALFIEGATNPQGFAERARKMRRWAFGLTIPAAVLAVVATWIALPLVLPAYSGSLRVLMILALAVPAVTETRLRLNKWRVQDRTRAMTVTALLQVACLLGLVVVLRDMGATGGALAWLGASYIAATACTILDRGISQTTEVAVVDG